MLKDLAYLKRLIKFAVQESPLFYLSSLLALISVFVEILAMTSLLPLSALATHQPLSQKSLIVRALSFFGQIPSVKILLLTFLGLFGLRIFTNLAALGSSLFLAKQFQGRLAAKTFDMVVRSYSIQDIEKKPAGYFITIAGDETSRAGTVISYSAQFLSVFALAAMYYLAIVYQSPKMGMALSLFLVMSFVGLWGAFKKSQALGVKRSHESKTMSSLFMDTLGGLRSVKAFSAEDYVVSRFGQGIVQYTKTLFKAEFLTLSSKLAPVAFLLVVCFFYIVARPSSYWDGLDLGFALTMIIFVMRFFPAAGACLNLFIQMLAESKSGQDVTQILHDADQITSKPGRSLVKPVEQLKVNQLNFAYEKNKTVLKNFDAVFDRGKSYAVKGPSGAGKSTLVDVILQFYSLQDGKIQFNGEDIRQIDGKSLRKHVLLLGQQTTIFNDTVFHNITYGANYSKDQVLKACRLACVEDVIDQLPQGLETVLNYQGSNLSGGQRQRIGLARALLREPDVLILDESTSALDTEIRQTVVRNILTEFKNKIVIFVTHDPVVCQQVDHIVNVEKVAFEGRSPDVIEIV